MAMTPLDSSNLLRMLFIIVWRNLGVLYKHQARNDVLCLTFASHLSQRTNNQCHSHLHLISHYIPSLPKAPSRDFISTRQLPSSKPWKCCIFQQVASLKKASRIKKRCYKICLTLGRPACSIFSPKFSEKHQSFTPYPTYKKFLQSTNHPLRKPI